MLAGAPEGQQLVGAKPGGVGDLGGQGMALGLRHHNHPDLCRRVGPPAGLQARAVEPGLDALQLADAGQDLKRLAVQVEGLLPHLRPAFLQVLNRLLRRHVVQALVPVIHLQPLGGTGQRLLVGTRRSHGVNLSVVAVGVPGRVKSHPAAHGALGLVVSLAEARHRPFLRCLRVREAGGGSAGWCWDRRAAGARV